MSIRIDQPGLFTTVQDKGRTGYQAFGFSPGGAMDQRALTLSNLLVGNPIGEAALEMTFLGAAFTFTKSNVIAITGGNGDPTLNGEPVPMYRSVAVQAGDTVAIGYIHTGCRTYVAFAGGFDLPSPMGSKSTQVKYGLGGYQGRALKMGDELAFANPRETLPGMASRSLTPPETSESTVMLRVILGPQADAFTKEGIQTFLSEPYALTKESDRMGCKLEGPEIAFVKEADIISDGIALGSVQVPSSGKPIVLLCDRQTTGGYAKIATVITVDMPRIAQLKPGDTVRFKSISVPAAQRLYRREQKMYQTLQKKLSKA